MDEIKALQAESKGMRAQELLQNEILQEVFQTLKNDYIEKWKTTSARDSDARERLWQAVNIVDLVKDHIRYIVDKGKLSTKELAKIKYPKP